MRRAICMLLLVGLLAALPAQATQLIEAIMIYEDYDGNHAEWTVNDEDELKELQDMLIRARNNKATLENCTMNCTLMCRVDDEDIIDFAIATDGCPYITDRSTDQTYRLTDEDQARLWEIFAQIQEAMGYDAALFMDW